MSTTKLEIKSESQMKKRYPLYELNYFQHKQLQLENWINSFTKD